MRKIFFLFLGFIFFPSFVFAARHEVHLSTYYPSPFGVYESIYLKPKQALKSEPCEIGTLYFSPQGKFMVCQDNGTGAGFWNLGAIALWGTTDKYVHFLDLPTAASKSVGIGTKTPICKLTLDDDGGILAKGALGDGPTIPSSGIETAFIWYQKKAAFRAGRVVTEGLSPGDQWDNGNIGFYSFATGLNTKASGLSSVAMGRRAYATGDSAIAIGYNAKAEGESSLALGNQVSAMHRSVAMGYKANAAGFFSVTLGYETSTTSGIFRSVAMGYQSSATGASSVAIGRQVKNCGTASVAMGNNTETYSSSTVAIGKEGIASGSNAIVLGEGSEASATASIAMGKSSKATADNSFALGYGCVSSQENSISIGRNATSSGQYAISLGNLTKAGSYLSLVVGEDNAINVGWEAANWVGTDPLFMIGKGNTGPSAVTVLKNGNVGIGEDTPTASLSVQGILNYADNSAAVAAGLPVCAVYRTDGVLKIVH